MNLQPIPLTEQVCQTIEHANYDGVPVTPYRAVQCPKCRAVAVIVNAYIGGYGRHTAYRCLGNRDHQGPVVLTRDGRCLTAQYMHDVWTYQVVPA